MILFVNLFIYITYGSNNDKCQSSFGHLKKILVEEPVLTQPTSGREYAMCSDASRFGLGCVLMQDGKVLACA